MEGYSAVLISVYISCSFSGVFSAPWTEPKGPVCTSHGGLCDVTFEISETDPLTGPVKYTSSSQICDCPGPNTCPNNSTDPSRVYYQEMSSPGQTITTRLSYCNMVAFPVRDCNQNEVAMRLRGIGPIIADIVGDMACKCSGPLVLHRAFPDGMYSIREYTCGKPNCDINSSKPPVCERVTYSMSVFGYSVQSEIPCQCPDGFICQTDNPVTLSSMFGKPTEFNCQLAP